jgi:hypothetical protein
MVKKNIKFSLLVSVKIIAQLAKSDRKHLTHSKEISFVKMAGRIL